MRNNTAPLSHRENVAMLDQSAAFACQLFFMASKIDIPLRNRGITLFLRDGRGHDLEISFFLGLPSPSFVYHPPNPTYAALFHVCVSSCPLQAVQEVYEPIASPITLYGKDGKISRPAIRAWTMGNDEKTY